jgi:glycosyltransferase involved in cell wall biosynthesis
MLTHRVSGDRPDDPVHFRNVSDERVFRNDWARLKPPAIGAWTPTRSVSVIIPAYNDQESLEPTLAALSRQTYPADLLDVVVVDDGSTPPVTLPEVRPQNCRIVRVPDVSKGWGRSNALHTGAVHSSGEILHWLDADMVVFPEHIEAQARWHHVAPDVVTLGYKRFVNEGWLTPAEVVRRAEDGTLGEAFPPSVTGPHDYVEELIDKTNKLRGGDHLNFRAHVGATAALSRDFYLSTGGLNCDLRLGEDTEFGFRLTQAGALFVPEPAARSWHLGPSNMMSDGEALRRYNHPYLADLMPHPRWLRHGAQRTWRVPLVTAVVDAAGPLELVRTCVDRLLASDEHDLRVVLVGDWDSITDERRRVLADPLLDLRLIETTYRSESRVELATAAPADVYPSPYRLNVPNTVGVGLSTVRRLVAEADRWKAGLVRAVPPKRSHEDSGVELWRTAAVSRAGRHARTGESLVDTVAGIYGQRWVSGTDFEIDDLGELPVTKLVSPRPRLGAAGVESAAPVRASDTEDLVVVGGLRSLLKAARVVATQGLRRIRTR